jgi:uncharacterized protein (TIGR02145 family)
MTPSKAQKTGVFKDARDGKYYKTVKIGIQTWMAENLAYLPSVIGPDVGSYEDPYYYIYGYEGTNVSEAKATENFKIYGVLYNWEAAKIACPSSWHLPSDEEWKTLEMYLGMSKSDANDTMYRGTDEGNKLKSTTGWESNRKGTSEISYGTNESGFYALPSGYRDEIGSFWDLDYTSAFWSSTVLNDNKVWCRLLSHFHSEVYRYNRDSNDGLLVRCLRD